MLMEEVQKMHGEELKTEWVFFFFFLLFFPPEKINAWICPDI